MVSECKDADRFDRGPRTRARKDTQHTCAYIISHSMGTLLKIRLKTRVSLLLREMTKPKLSVFFMLGKALCKHIRSDPLQSCIYCRKIVIPFLH